MEELTDILHELHKMVAAQTEEILRQREEILRAFIAETGLLPSECEQVIEINGAGMRWYVRKREGRNE